MDKAIDGGNVIGYDAGRVSFPTEDDAGRIHRGSIAFRIGLFDLNVTRNGCETFLASKSFPIKSTPGDNMALYNL